MFKKGQVETMGLVVIIILIIFIALFFLKYSGGNKKVEDRFLSIKINNYLNALNLINVGDSKFASLAMECCNSGFSCDQVSQIVNSSFGFLDEEAHFELRCIDDTMAGVFEGSSCNSYIASGKVVFITGDEMSARICRK
jgi:hypothetical protein